MAYRWSGALAVLLAVALVASAPRAQNTPPAKGPPTALGSDHELVERVIVLRRDYQRTLEQLRAHYLKVGNYENARWAEEELRQYHRIPHYPFILSLDAPPPNLSGNVNVPEANKLLTWALTFKDKGWGTDYIDNQRRAELLLQELLSKYPQSSKIADAAYLLGDIYESKAYKMYRRAAIYYERCFQWHPKTQHDARIRAARLYDAQIKDRGRAIELYQEVTTHEIEPRRIQEATKRLQELRTTR